MAKVLQIAANGIRAVKNRTGNWEFIPDHEAWVSPKQASLAAHLGEQLSDGFRRVYLSPKVRAGLQCDVTPVEKNSNVRDAYAKYAREVDEDLWKAIDRWPHPTADVPCFGFGPTPVYLQEATCAEEEMVRIYRSRMYQNPSAPMIKTEVTPLFYFKYSYVTGGSEEGLKRVMSLFNHAIVTPDMDVDLTSQAFANTMADLTPDVKRPVPDLSAKALVRDDFEPQKYAGIVLSKTGEEDVGDYIIKYVNTPTKAGALAAAEKEHVINLEKIALSGAEHYVGGIIRKHVAACFVKPEIREPGGDLDKVRLIFITTLYKYLVDKLIYPQAYEYMFQKGGVLIGWSKTKGGMQFLYDSLKRDPKTHFWMELDFAKLDFTMMPHILALVLSFPLWYYDPNDPMYPLMRYFVEWSIDCGVSKYLNIMPDQVYMVIGQMFSGEVYTSIGDTIYVLMAFWAFKIYVYRDLKAKGMEAEAAEWWDDNDWRWVYGDDTIAVFPSFLYPYVAGKPWAERHPDDQPEGLIKFFSKMRLDVKRSDTHLFFQKDDEDDRDPLLSYPDGRGGLLHPIGPKILQRHFVKASYDPDVLSEATSLKLIVEEDGTKRLWWPEGNTFVRYEGVVLPYRTIQAYLTRGSVSTTNNSDEAMYCKVIGLAYDTAGTNLQAYKFLKGTAAYLYGIGLDEEIVRRVAEDQWGSSDALRRVLIDFGPEVLKNGYPIQGDVLVWHLPNEAGMAHYEARSYVTKRVARSHNRDLDPGKTGIWRFPLNGLENP